MIWRQCLESLMWMMPDALKAVIVEKKVSTAVRKGMSAANARPIGGQPAGNSDNRCVIERGNTQDVVRGKQAARVQDVKVTWLALPTLTTTG